MEQQLGSGKAAAVGVVPGAGPGLDEEAFETLLEQAVRGETAAGGLSAARSGRSRLVRSLALALVLALVMLAPGSECSKLPSRLGTLRQQQATSLLRGASSKLLVSSWLLVSNMGSATAAVAPPSAPSLARRILETDSAAYEPGLLQSDLFFPDWLLGTWKTNSTATGVSAPLGITAFGGQRALDVAQREVGSSLIYDSRWVRADDGQRVIADRLFNVKSIARAAMGEASVVEDGGQFGPGGEGRVRGSGGRQPSPSRQLHLVIAPPGQDLLDVDLFPTDRDAQITGPLGYECFERTAQLLSRRMDQLIAAPNSAPSSRKDVETITIYRLVDPLTIVATQRTATFLTAADSRYNAVVAANPLAATRAIDIRFYSITYTRREG